TVHHYFKTGRSVNPEDFKNFECILKCSSENHKRYDETGFHEDHPRTGRPRVTSAAEDKLVFPLGLQLSAARCAAWRGHRHKRLKESWCSCVSFDDSSQYNNYTSEQDRKSTRLNSS